MPIQLRPSRGVLCLLAASLLITAPGLAGPLNLDDPTPRTVRLEFDEDISDFAAMGLAYGQPHHVQFASDGVVATVTMPGPDLEALLNTLFSGLFSAVPGSFSDFVIRIDVATREVLSVDASGTISTSMGNLDVTQTASSTGLAGFLLRPFLGTTFPFFCVAGVDCTIVSGKPYDPATGTLFAVGRIASLLDFFTPFGDMRLSEVTPWECDTSMVARTFVTGDFVTLSGLSVRNNDRARPVELKIWIEPPGEPPLSAQNVGADGSFLVPVQAFSFPWTDLMTVDATTLRGNWAVGCRILDPATGEELVSDRDPFVVQ